MKLSCIMGGGHSPFDQREQVVNNITTRAPRAKAAPAAAAEPLRLLKIFNAEQWLCGRSYQFSGGKVRRVMPPGDGNRTEQASQNSDSTSIGGTEHAARTTVRNVGGGISMTVAWHDSKPVLAGPHPH